MVNVVFVVGELCSGKTTKAVLDGRSSGDRFQVIEIGDKVRMLLKSQVRKHNKAITKELVAELVNEVLTLDVSIQTVYLVGPREIKVVTGVSEELSALDYQVGFILLEESKEILWERFLNREDPKDNFKSAEFQSEVKKREMFERYLKMDNTLGLSKLIEFIKKTK